MTYTYRLSRRLAIVRRHPTLILSALGIACAGGEPIGPSAPPPSDATPSAVRVELVPGTVTVETEQAVQFRARGLDAQGDSTAVSVEWTATGGTISSDGNFKSATAGQFRIVAKNRGSGNQSDTATVVVVSARSNLRAIEILPATASLGAGQTTHFTAIGRLSSGDTATVGLVWSATGGSIDPSGTYQAPRTPGQHKVIATNTNRRIADTAQVTVTAPVLARIVLLPATVSLAAGQTATFSAYGRTSVGDSVPVATTYTATGGTITSAGVYTAGGGAGTFRVIAVQQGGTLADTSSVTITAGPVLQTIAVTPATVSLAPGGTQQFTATGKMSDGSTAPLSGATYQATGGTISSTGLYTAGATIGTYKVTVTSGGKTGTADVTITTSGSTPRVGRYVSPTGTAGGNGTSAAPWDLASVLSGSKPIQAGDTVWLRGGVYRGAWTGQLSGTPGAPIVFRAYPGERVTLLNPSTTNSFALTLPSSTHDVVWWGVEFAFEAPDRAGSIAVSVKSQGTKLINCVVHDAGESGIGWWRESGGGELAGTIIYNNGVHTNLDHGVYHQNNTGTLLLRDNLVFNNLTYGLQCYGGSYDRCNDVTWRGNVVWGNGDIDPNHNGGNLVADGASVDRLTLDSMYLYYSSPTRYEGRLEKLGSTFRFTNSIVRSSTSQLLLNGLTTGSVLQNVQWVTGALPNLVIVRPNPYEQGRAHIIVYNGANAGMVSADLSAVLRPGDAYEIHHVYNLWGTPVARGTYSGGTVSLPMAAVTAPTPLGPRLQPAALGPEFGVFVVTRS